ncbi:hypothetical protein E4U43_000676 [Claviceps pusilla]|uniref:Uncharacterized protein n=1 Tax=Claviceps pusilla TaxID=123648 RepID=A0A9P7N9E5_9HYPO|nr:hypothetical protein E4U43_000676 [Claviceps pusilla]
MAEATSYKGKRPADLADDDDDDDDNNNNNNNNNSAAGSALLPSSSPTPPSPNVCSWELRASESSPTSLQALPGISGPRPAETTSSLKYSPVNVENGTNQGLVQDIRVDSSCHGQHGEIEHKILEPTNPHAVVGRQGMWHRLSLASIGLTLLFNYMLQVPLNLNKALQ